MSKGLTKVRGIQFDLPPAGTTPSQPAAATALPARAPVTGIMRHSASVQQAQEAQARIQQLERERGAQPLDPKTIRSSRWANRHPDSFTSADFAALRDEINNAGGNVQPIKVRPLTEPDGPARYEVVFGHRRHRACLDLGLPVLAVVQEMPDTDLFVEMERENRGRASLSAWEQGQTYRTALDSGLYPSVRRLAAAIGRDHSDVAKALRIIDLPEQVVSAFPSPTAIQHRWAVELSNSVEADRERVLAAAADPGLKSLPPRLIFAALVGKGVGQSHTKLSVGQSHTPSCLDLGHGRRAEVRVEGARTVIEFDTTLIEDLAGWVTLEKALRKITAGTSKS